MIFTANIVVRKYCHEEIFQTNMCKLPNENFLWASAWGNREIITGRRNKYLERNMLQFDVENNRVLEALRHIHGATNDNKIVDATSNEKKVCNAF